MGACSSTQFKNFKSVACCGSDPMVNLDRNTMRIKSNCCNPTKTITIKKKCHHCGSRIKVINSNLTSESLSN